MPKDPVVGFDDLVSVAHRLNSASDNLTAALRAIETKLKALGLGVERFVPIPGTREWRDDDETVRDWEEDHLGYARLGEGWGFVVRLAHFSDDGSGSGEGWEFGEEKPLLRASRDMRIKAAAAIPQLFRELKAEADAMLTVVEQAQHLAVASGDEANENGDDENDPRFTAFVKGTRPDERDRAAFAEFEQAIDSATQCATMMNGYDNEPGTDQEYRVLRMAVSEMFYRTLPKVGFGTILASGEGIGSAIRYGVLNASGDALDHVENAETFEQIAHCGWTAERDLSEARERELKKRK